MDGWNTFSFPFGMVYFQGRTVSFRECIASTTSSQNMIITVRTYNYSYLTLFKIKGTTVVIVEGKLKTWNHSLSSIVLVCLSSTKSWCFRLVVYNLKAYPVSPSSKQSIGSDFKNFKHIC